MGHAGGCSIPESTRAISNLSSYYVYMEEAARTFQFLWRAGWVEIPRDLPQPFSYRSLQGDEVCRNGSATTERLDTYTTSASD
jgi:hypothetical protein